MSSIKTSSVQTGFNFSSDTNGFAIGDFSYETDRKYALNNAANKINAYKINKTQHLINQLKKTMKIQILCLTSIEKIRKKRIR